MDPALIGVLGGAVGVLGGVVGTYFSVRNAAGGRECAFMIRASVACWLFVAGFLAMLWLTPRPYQVYLWFPYVLLLPRGIVACNRRLEQIRQEGDGHRAKFAGEWRSQDGG